MVVTKAVWLAKCKSTLHVHLVGTLMLLFSSVCVSTNKPFFLGLGFVAVGGTTLGKYRADTFVGFANADDDLPSLAVRVGVQNLTIICPISGKLKFSSGGFFPLLIRYI